MAGHRPDRLRRARRRPRSHRCARRVRAFRGPAARRGRDRPRLGGRPAGGALRGCRSGALVRSRRRPCPGAAAGCAGDLRRHRRARGVARASRTARARRGGAVRLRRHWHQRHARRLGAELRTDRTDPALRRVLRRPDRPCGAGSPARGGEPRPRAHVGRRVAAQPPRPVPRCQGALVPRDGDGPGRPGARSHRAAHPSGARRAHARADRWVARRRRRPTAARRSAACGARRPSRPWAVEPAFRLSRNVFRRRCAAR